MTTEEWNVKLYKQAESEMAQFTDWLSQQPAREILSHAYEYTVKSDILMTLENVDFTMEQCRALLQSPSLLEDLYKGADKIDLSVLDILQDCIENRADTILKAQQEKTQQFVYPHSASYARENWQLEQYRESTRLNIACKDAMEAAIAKHYDGANLDVEAVHQVVSEFGKARTSFILINTIQAKEYDGRFSAQNKSWARPYLILPDVDSFGNNRRLEYVVNAHPVLVNGFADVFRKEYCQEKQPVQKGKPSVREKLNESAPKVTSPKISAKLKEAER